MLKRAVVDAAMLLDGVAQVVEHVEVRTLKLP